MHDSKIRKQCRDKNCQAVIAVGCYWYPDGSRGSGNDEEPTQRTNGRAKQRELTFFEDPDEPFLRVKPHLFVEVSTLVHGMMQPRNCTTAFAV